MQFLLDPPSPEEVQAGIASGIITREQAVELGNFLERTRCQSDLHYLTTQVLGYADLGAIHQPLCALIESVNDKLARAGLRDTCATSSSYSNYYNSSKYSNSSKHLNTNQKDLTNHQATSSGAKTDSGGMVGGMDEGKPPTKNPITFSNPSINIANTVIAPFTTWNDEAQTRLWLMFRGSFKTTVLSIAHTIQLMLRFPDIRILIASHKKEGGSQEILGAVKRHFIGNEKLRKLFPEYCPKTNQAGVIDWGTSEKVTLPNRSGTAVFPEATVEIAGHTTEMTGRHYDYIKADDLVTKDSVTNETMLQKTRQYFALLKFLFNQPEWGIMDVIGTPYHFADLYATLGKSKGISKVSVPAISEGRITFPERFTLEGVDRIKHEAGMSSYEFSCQYLLNPVPTEDQTFRPEWFEIDGFYYKTAPKNLRKYVFVDPATKRRKDSDFTAIMAIGVDEVNDWWLLDIIRDKLNVDERTQLAIDLAKKHNTHKVAYETIGFQDTDTYIMKRKAKECGWYITIDEIKASQMSKEDRIRGLQPMYEQGKVHWPSQYSYYSRYEHKTLDMVELLRDEMLMFPKCEHDDMVDCHSFILRVATQVAHASKEQPKDSHWDWLMGIVREQNKRKPPTFTGYGKGYIEIPAQKSWR